MYQEEHADNADNAFPLNLNNITNNITIKFNKLYQYNLYKLKMDKLEYYQPLLKKFLTVYINNLKHVSQHNIKNTNTVKNTVKNNNKKNNSVVLKTDTIRRFARYLGIISNIFKIDDYDDILMKIKELLKLLVLHIINFNTVYKPLPNTQK